MTNTKQPCAMDRKEWSLAQDKARDAAACVGDMANHAASAIGAMAGDAVCEVGRRADDFAATAGARIHGLGETLSDRAPHQGMLGSASQAVARGVKESGEYLEGAKLSGVTEDVAELVRRNPIPAVLIALGLGWFFGRKL